MSKFVRIMSDFIANYNSKNPKITSPPDFKLTKMLKKIGKLGGLNVKSVVVRSGGKLIK